MLRGRGPDENSEGFLWHRINVPGPSIDNGLEDDGMIKKILQKAWELLRHPVETFRNSKENRFEDAVIYYGVLLCLNAVLSGIFINQFGLLRIIGFIIGFIPAIIFIGMIGFSIWISVVHVCVYLCGGRKGMDKTFVSAMYGLTPLLLMSWIVFPLSGLELFLPVLAGLFGWSVVLIILGIRELHEISTLRAVFAVTIPVVITGVLYTVLDIEIFSHMRAFHATDFQSTLKR